MTAFERSKIKMTDQQVAAREAKEREMAGKRQVSEEDYARQMRLDEANTNRCASAAPLRASPPPLPRLSKHTHTATQISVPFRGSKIEGKKKCVQKKDDQKPYIIA